MRILEIEKKKLHETRYTTEILYMAHCTYRRQCASHRTQRLGMKACDTHTKKKLCTKLSAPCFELCASVGVQGGTERGSQNRPNSNSMVRMGRDGLGAFGGYINMICSEGQSFSSLAFHCLSCTMPPKCILASSCITRPTALHRLSARKKLHMLILLVISLPRGLVLTSLLKSLAWTELFATLLWCWSATASILTRSLQIWMCTGNCRVQLKEVHYEPIPCCSRSVCYCSSHWLNNCTVSFGTFYLYSATVLRNSAFVPSDGVRWHECFLLLGY